MNLSKVYDLPSGPLALCLLKNPVTDPKNLPENAPRAVVAETMLDLYLLVTSDPANTIAPVRIQVINANVDQLKAGQMLWFNLTEQDIGGIVGSQKLLLRAQSRSVMDAPTSKSEGYAVNLSYRRVGNESPHPLCETQWPTEPRRPSPALCLNRNRSPHPPSSV